MAGLLVQIEHRFEAMRRTAPAPLAACAEALAEAAPGHDGGAWGRAAEYIAAALAETLDETLAGAGHELPYHNRHHFAEATLAMGWLCGAARAAGAIDTTDAAAGVLAMLGHDIGHDGSAIADGRLEAASAARIAAIAGAAGLDKAVVSRIRDVILATDPALVARNQAANATPASLLRRLANEADVFASLLPRLGPVLGEALAAERGLPATRPRHRERLAFLTVYRSFSAPACQLGLASCREAQLAALAALDPAGIDPAAGADRLDQRAAAAVVAP